MRKTWATVLLLAASVLAFVEPALADGGDAKPNLNWNELSGVLLPLLAVVLVMESALSALFQWRVYQIAFNTRALKTPIMFAVGLLLVWVTGYDPMSKILSVATGAKLGEGWGQWVLTYALSALIIAGGSAGLFELLKRLGIRAPENSAEQAVKAALDYDQAWLSVRAVNAKQYSPVQIGIEELTAADEENRWYFYDQAKFAPLAGTIDSRSFWARARGAFTADANRFPNYGGHKVVAGKHYRVMAAYQSDTGPKSVGVFRGRFASRAVIDLTFDVNSEPKIRSSNFN